MKYLFWNTNRKSLEINNIIVEIVKEYSCDIIVLAEYISMDDLNSLIYDLNRVGDKKYTIDRLTQLTGDERIKIILPIASNLKIETILDEGHYIIEKMIYDEQDIQLMCCVHFPSKMHDIHAAPSLARRLKADIEKYEGNYNTDKTIVLGDFNMNPFEDGMLSSDSLHAISSENDASKKERTINNKKSKMFFNPMWSFLGEYCSYKGTYYYNGSGVVCNFWNTFDQFIIRPSLIDNLSKDSIKIIVKINNIDLCKRSGTPNGLKYSDHLPLCFELTDEVIK